MLQRATNDEIKFILSKAMDSANEGTKAENAISFEKAQGFLNSVLYAGGYYMVHRDNNGELEGWALVGENVDFLTDTRVGFIYDLYVLPAFRGKGLGKRIIKQCIKELKGKGYGEVRLNVYERNFAKEIYKEIGFKELQTIMYIET